MSNRQYWLIKTEPSTYSIQDLSRAKNQIAHWDGVRNYQARNYLKTMQIGDLAFFYHSSCPTPAIVGIVNIVKADLIDISAFDPKSPYFDPKSHPDHPRWTMVDVKLKQTLTPPITLQALRANPTLVSCPLLKKGNRLSVIPITFQQWQAILAMH